MSDAKRDFTGVFIPAHIWESKELIPAEKMLLGEIDALSKRSGWCEAGRKHFAEWLQCTPENVSLYTSKLEKLGFIEVLRTPGYGSKLRVINARFYEQQPVSGTYGGSKPGLRGVVSQTYGGSKPGLPVNKSININKKIKEERMDGKEVKNSQEAEITPTDRPTESLDYSKQTENKEVQNDLPENTPKKWLEIVSKMQPRKDQINWQFKIQTPKEMIDALLEAGKDTLFKESVLKNCDMKPDEPLFPFFTDFLEAWACNGADAQRYLTTKDFRAHLRSFCRTRKQAKIKIMQTTPVKAESYMPVYGL